MMNTDVPANYSTFFDRKSVRAFTDEKIPRETLEKILITAQTSPSWCNTQGWKSYVVEGRKIQELSTILSQKAQTEEAKPHLKMPQEYRGTYKERRKVSGIQLYQSLGIGPEDREASQAFTLKNFEFFGAAHVLILCASTELADYGLLDTGIYLGHLLLAAQAHEVDTIALASLARYSEVVAEFINLPENFHVVCGVAFGKADLDAPQNTFRTERADLEEIATFLK